MRFRCILCGPPPDGFLFEADLPECPRCHATGPARIAPIVDVHFVVIDPSGLIEGAEGRQFVACQKRRDALAMHRFDTFAATGDPAAVTCRSCMGTPWWKQASAADQAIQRRMRIQEQLARDCCG